MEEFLFLGEDGDTEELGRNGMVELIIAQMAQAQLCENVVLSGLNDLLRLCRGSEANCRRFGSNGLKLVVSAISKRYTRPPLLNILCRLFAECSDVLYRFASKQEYVAMIFTAMKTYEMAEDVQAAAMYATTVIVDLDPGVVATLQKGGVVQLMLKAMRMHENGCRTQTNGLLALCMLQLPCRKVVDEMHAQKDWVKAIFKAFTVAAAHTSELREENDDYNSLLACCRYLGHVLRINMQCRTAASEQGCIEAIRKILSSDLQCISLQKAGLQLMAWMMQPASAEDRARTCQRCVQAGLISYMNDVMQEYFNDEEIMTVCCLLIESIAECNEECLAACETCIPALAGVMKKNTTSKSVSMMCVTAMISLTSFTCTDRVSTLMVKLDVVRLVMDAAHRHNDLPIQSLAIQLAGQIGIYKTTTFSKVVGKDIDLVLKVMRTCIKTDETYTLRMACFFLATCCRFSEGLKELIGASKGHQVVLQIMKAHQSDESVVYTAIAVCAALADDNKKNQDRLAQCNLQEFARAAKHHAKATDFVLTIAPWIQRMCKNHAALRAKLQALEPEVFTDELFKPLPGQNEVVNEIAQMVAVSTKFGVDPSLVARRAEKRKAEAARRTTQTCSVCYKTAYEAGLKGLLKCSACTIAPFYCTAQCQKAGWPQHKAECKANPLNSKVKG